MTEPFFSNLDGRRRSDPRTTLDVSPAKAPDWQLSRVVSAADAAYTKRTEGVNAGGFTGVRFSVVPMTADPRTSPAAVVGGLANPATEIRVWSDESRTFVPMSTPIAHTAAGVGVPHVIDVPNANGSIVACFVTSTPAGVVAISAQGYNAEAL
jgi:hypothetical protein